MRIFLDYLRDGLLLFIGLFMFAAFLLTGPTPLMGFFFNACTDSGTGSLTFNSAASWTSCGGTYPQSADTWTITQSIMTVPAGSFTTAGGRVNGASAQLRMAAGATLVGSSTATSGLVRVTQGCSAVSGQCTSAYAIDTSAAGAGTEAAFTDTFATSNAVVYNDGAPDSNANLPHTIITGPVSGTANGLNWGGVGASGMVITNSHFVNGFQAIFTNNLSSLTANSNWCDTQRSSCVEIGPGSSFFPSPCSISNNTETGNTDNSGSSANSFILSLQGSCTGNNIVGNAMQGDSTHSHLGIALNSGSAPAALSSGSYNILYSQTANQTSIFTYGLIYASGTSSFHHTLANNYVEGFNENYFQAGLVYIDYSHNGCRMSAAVAPSGQGCYVWFSNTQNVTSTYDWVTFDPALGGSSPNGAIAFFPAGNGSASGSATMLNDAAYFPIDSSLANTGVIEFGDAAAPNSGVQPPSSFIGSVVTGGVYSLLSQSLSFNVLSAASTCSSKGAGGICYNNYYGANTAASSPGTAGTGGTNWDDGVHVHGANAAANTTYAETAYNPFPAYLPTASRSLSDVDRIFGGPGTVADLFSQLAKRWNSTNDARFTPQNIWVVLNAAIAPQDVRFATSGPSGGLQGAVAPINIQAMVLVP